MTASSIFAVAFVLLMPLQGLAGNAPALPSVYLEELTWPEARAAIDAGYTGVIVPTGGTEQNGRHMVLGKHNYIVRYTAGEIARRVGHTLVAPVISYVPEGDPESGEGHMAYAGTISLPDADFAKLLEAAARSLKTHGFKMIYFVGDSGGNQAAQKKVADDLTDAWEEEGIKVIHVGAYYHPARDRTFLEQKGFSRDDIGTHAGMIDTSELWAVYPDGIRRDQLHVAAKKGSPIEKVGSIGNPSKASVKLGEELLELKIQAVVEQILPLQHAPEHSLH